MTDCNNCEHETECNHDKRYDYKNNGVVDYQTNKDIESYSEIADILNKQDKRINGLNHLLKQYSLFFDENDITFNDFLLWLQNKTENKK